MKTEEGVQQRLRSMTERELGAWGERICRRIFEASNVFYFPLTAILEGGAPMLLGPSKRVSPDFDCSGRRWRAFIDSKAKRQSKILRIARDERHGIDRKRQADYLSVGEKMRKKCGLMIVELWREAESGLYWSGSVLLESLARLGHGQKGMEKSDQKHMVYWSRGAFKEIHATSAAGLDDIACGRVRPPNLEARLNDVFDFAQEFQGALWQ